MELENEALLVNEQKEEQKENVPAPAEQYHKAEARPEKNDEEALVTPEKELVQVNGPAAAMPQADS